MIYLAPTICVLCGAGLDWMIGQLREARTQTRALTAASLALVVIIVVGAIRDLAEPYKLPQYAAARAALRDVATYISATDRVAVANAEHDRLRPPDGPEFHPTLRYYLTLYTGVWPHFCQAAAPPPMTRWMLTFYGAEFGPQPPRLAELLAPAGLRAVLHRDYPLSPRVDWRLGVYRCEPAVSTNRAP
jgi:hypothetical protein